MRLGKYTVIFILLFSGAVFWKMAPFSNKTPPLTLIATTTTESSGFLDYIIPLVAKDTGIALRVITFGTGKVLRTAQDGNADLILVHDPVSEKKFINHGHGLARHPIMKNDFILIGPKQDPAGLKKLPTIDQIFEKLSEGTAIFISRGDDSGTHKAEKRLWHGLGLEPEKFSSKWYRKSGAGMGRSLNIAVESESYILSDRASWLTFHHKGRLEILHQKGEKLKNIYSIIAINPAKHPHLQTHKAQKIINWFISAKGQTHIQAFKHKEKALYLPIS